jgi:hypothetical protein
MIHGKTPSVIVTDDFELPADRTSDEAPVGLTAGGAPNAPGLFSKLRAALRGQAAAGATTHDKSRRRQRAREHGVAMLALDALGDLEHDKALAVMRTHLRARTDLDPFLLHRFASQLDRYADELERGRG